VQCDILYPVKFSRSEDMDEQYTPIDLTTITERPETWHDVWYDCVERTTPADKLAQIRTLAEKFLATRKENPCAEPS
jgi:hypothetical protein